MEILLMKLMKISNQLRGFESLLSPFLLVSILMNSMLGMSNICYLVTQYQKNTSSAIRFISAINLMTCFVKLIIYFYFGEKISSAFNQMKKKLEKFTISENISNHDWKQWIAIKDMSQQNVFKFSVMNLFEMQQKTGLIVFSIIIQYAVILIQTNV